MGTRLTYSDFGAGSAARLRTSLLLQPRLCRTRSSHPSGAAMGSDVCLAPEGGAGASVVPIPGGGWSYGSREVSAERRERAGRSGFVAVSIAYRLGTAGRWPHA